MPTKKTDKKTKKPKAKTATKVVKQKTQRATVTPFQKQTQIVNINLAKTTARKSKGNMPLKVTSLGNTYYQPVSQAPNAFSLADVAKLIPNYVSQQVSSPIPIPIPIPSKSEIEYEGSFVPLPKRKPVNLKLPERTIAKPTAEFENLVYTNLPVASEDIKLKKTVTKKPKKTTLPLPNPPKKPPAIIQKPSNEAVTISENPIVEERTLTLMPPSEEILRQIKKKNKPRRQIIIEDESEGENVVISTQPEVIVPKKVRRTRQQIDEAKMMGKEDIASINLGLSQFN